MRWFEHPMPRAASGRAADTSERAADVSVRLFTSPAADAGRPAGMQTPDGEPPVGAGHAASSDGSPWQSGQGAVTPSPTTSSHDTSASAQLSGRAPSAYDQVEAYCRGCRRTLPLTDHYWGKGARKAIRPQARPVPETQGLFVNRNHMYQCVSCRTGNQPFPAPGSGLAEQDTLARIAQLEGRLLQLSQTPAPIGPTGAVLAQQLADQVRAFAEAARPTAADHAALAEAFTRARELVAPRGAPVLKRTDAPYVRAVSMWAARYVVTCSGQVVPSRMAASAFAFGVDQALKFVLVKHLSVTGRNTASLEGMGMDQFVQLVHSAVPVPDASMQVSEWRNDIACRGSSETDIDDYILEYQTFFRSHPEYKPGPEDTPAARHARAELNRQFVLGLPRSSPLRGRLRGSPEKWEAGAWADLLAHVASIRLMLHGRRDEAPPRRLRTELYVTHTSPNSQPPSIVDAAGSHARLTFPDGALTPTSPSDDRATPEGAAGADTLVETALLRLTQSRLADPRYQNCLHCSNAPSKHTFETCTEANRFRKEGRDLCEKCWTDGFWGYRSHSQSACKRGATDKPDRSRVSTDRSPVGPPPRFSVPTTSLCHIVAEIPPLSADADPAMQALHSRLTAIQHEFQYNTSPPASNSQ